jgi:hypothetical protein
MLGDGQQFVLPPSLLTQAGNGTDAGTDPAAMTTAVRKYDHQNHP